MPGSPGALRGGVGLLILTGAASACLRVAQGPSLVGGRPPQDKRSIVNKQTNKQTKTTKRRIRAWLRVHTEVYAEARQLGSGGRRGFDVGYLKRLAKPPCGVLFFFQQAFNYNYNDMWSLAG